MVTYNVYPPNCAANLRSDKWRCEVRNDGWIADWKLFDTEEEAQTWGRNHNGEISKPAAQEINNMIHRWANK